MDLLTGNAYDQDTRGTGWFIGFSDWTRHGLGELLHVPREQPLTGLCVKWWDHPAGDDSGEGKPLSEGRTVSLLVSDASLFRIEFSPHPDFRPEGLRTVLLRRQGDFAAWGPGWHHRWHALERATVMSLRWSPP